MSSKLTNWAGNYQYRAPNLFRPKSIEEIRELVVKSEKVKALGSRHCFNDIADCDETQISLQNFNQIVSINEKAMTSRRSAFRLIRHNMEARPEKLLPDPKILKSA